MTRFGSPALDLSYYLLSSTDKELRDKHFDDFIQVYYKSVADTIRKCGSDPDKLFTFENLQEHLNKFGKFGVVLAPLLCEIWVADPANIKDMGEYFNEIHAGQSSEGLSKFSESSEKAFKKRLDGVFEDATKYGWI